MDCQHGVLVLADGKFTGNDLTICYTGPDWSKAIPPSMKTDVPGGHDLAWRTMTTYRPG